LLQNLATNALNTLANLLTELLLNPRSAQKDQVVLSLNVVQREDVSMNHLFVKFLLEAVLNINAILLPINVKLLFLTVMTTILALLIALILIKDVFILLNVLLLIVVLLLLVLLMELALSLQKTVTITILALLTPVISALDNVSTPHLVVVAALEM